MRRASTRTRAACSTSSRGTSRGGPRPTAAKGGAGTGRSTSAARGSWRARASSRPARSARSPWT
eukprot:1637245-Alexandrium_andersonii.AAC.1